MKIPFKLGSETTSMYQYSTTGSAGLDLPADIDEPRHLIPGEVRTIPTGIHIDLSGTGLVGLVFARSGLGSSGLVLANGTGVIDPDYQGQIILKMWNRTQARMFTIESGQRVAQLVLVPFVRPEWVQVEEFTSKSERGSGGFGSTGE